MICKNGSTVCVCVCFWVRVFKVVSWCFKSHEALFEVLPKLVKTLSLMFLDTYTYRPFCNLTWLLGNPVAPEGWKLNDEIHLTNRGFSCLLCEITGQKIRKAPEVGKRVFFAAMRFFSRRADFLQTDGQKHEVLQETENDSRNSDVESWLKMIERCVFFLQPTFR